MTADRRLTDDQIRQWEREKASLEHEIAERQAKLSDITEKLRAVAVLWGASPAKAARPASHANGNGKDNQNMAAAIERIVTASSAPLAKKQLKEKLAAEHFSEERLGPYFYTCLMRLKKGHRVQVLEDGRVSKP